jgi:hypothetical protein
MTKHPCVYILASKYNGTLYVGVTSDIARRVWEHKSDAIEGFIKEYDVHDLVFMEFPETKNYPYWWLTRLLLKRVTKFCASESQKLYGEPRPVKMIFSRRGGMSYDRLISI